MIKILAMSRKILKLMHINKKLNKNKYNKIIEKVF